MIRRHRRHRPLRADRRGIVSLELALVLPVLILLLLGTADVVWLYLAQHKVQRAAAVVADLAARAAQLRPADVEDIFRAAREVTAPLDLADRGRIHLSSISALPLVGPRVVWQRTTSGGLVVASRVGSPGGAADLDGMTLNPAEEVVAGEVTLEVDPLIGLVVRGPQRLYARSLQRPRYGTVTLLPL